MTRIFVVAALLVACDLQQDSGEPLPDDTSDEADDTAPIADDTGSSDDTGDTGQLGEEARAMCAAWKASRAGLTGAWTGSAETCAVGEWTAPGPQSVLDRVNAVRALAGLMPVTLDATLSEKAQACALMMEAEGTISHTPSASWECYSAEGAEAAGKSSLATIEAVAAVDLYMIDPGNATTLGHRRWILSNWVGPIGVGSTDGYSCMWVVGGGTTDAHVAMWPPEGPVPMEIFERQWGQTTNETGWSVQSDAVDLDGASVTVSDGTQTLPVVARTLLPGYGSTSAIAFELDGWEPVAGGRYDVVVDAGSEVITYTVEPVDCP